VDVLLVQEIIITVVYQEIVIQVMVFTIGEQVKNMPVTGKIIKNTVKGQIIGNQVINTKETGRTMYKMVTADIHLQMVKFRKVFSDKESL